LDLSHYFSSPSLSWDTMLKMIGVKLELISDIDQFLFIEKGIRGGISYISNRYAKANNRFLNNYNPLKLLNFIIYLDANNLYGWAMSQNLPTGCFKWIDLNYYKNIPNKKGMILEVDLEYLDNLHNDYPLAPKKMKLKNTCSQAIASNSK